jgi:hypothetical protein
MADSIEDIGRRHGFGPEATREVAEALRRGDGKMAQFNHPELGGMGQWSAGGMLMIGDMFNNDLKGRVAALCADLASVAKSEPTPSPAQGGDWWPSGLGHPSSAGAQNDMRYACFPGKKRVAVMRGGKTTVYDTGKHTISGVSQQQGSDQTLTFSSQFGSVRVHDLRRV